MKNRLLLFVQILILLLAWQTSSAQLNYNGPEPLIVYDGCTIDTNFVGQVTYAGSGNIASILFDFYGVVDTSANNTTGNDTLFYTGTDITLVAGTHIEVLYDYTDGTLMLDTIYAFPIAVIDTVPPTFGAIPPALIMVDCINPLPPFFDVMAMDNCDVMVDTFLSETSSQTATGCTNSDYTLTRKYLIIDDSGNRDSVFQTINVLDANKPGFTPLADIVIDCQMGVDVTTVAFTGNITAADVMDCNDDITINFMDNEVTISGSCPEYREIERTWTVSDACGKDSIAIQMITVQDTMPPTFTLTAPADTTVSCEAGVNIGTIGMPANVMDNCDANPTITGPNDIVTSQTCQHGFELERKWYIEDACGNIDSIALNITVVDTIAPMITTEAVDETVDCDANFVIDQLFQDWINVNGGAVASDNCANDPLIWNAYNSGTTFIANLPAPTCPTATPTIYRQQVVDFVVEDACGNRDTTTATFTVTDIVSPDIQSCPNDTILNTELGICGANYDLIPPVASETCGGAIGSEFATFLLGITAPAGPPEDTPVDAITLNISVSPPPTVAFAAGTLVVDLLNVDGEDPTEFFFIYDENGDLVGQTAATSTQCGSSSVTIPFTTAELNAYAADGSITFTLEPNIPAGMLGRFAINNICNNNSRVRATFFYLNTTSTGPVYEYTINDGARINPGGFVTATELLETGVNDIKYYVTDCSGNVDSCMYQVTVIDNEAPTMDCPTDATVNLATDECTADYTLVLPSNISDNCGVGTPITSSVAANVPLTFYDDPNTGTYLAQDLTFQITGVAANANSSVTLSVDLLADSTGVDDFFTILGEDYNPIGTVTGIGCTTVNTTTFTISQADFNAWATDGVIDFTAVAELPPSIGNTNDGINPCNPAGVMNDGDVDGVSFLSATVTYREISPTYYATGATTFGPSQLQSPTFEATETFNLGTTEVFYTIVDDNNNADTCSYFINILDVENPMADCQPTFVTINPSGTVIDTIFPIEIDAGSTDNCTIDTMYVTRDIGAGNTVDCDDVGMVVDVTLTVIDASGNLNTCQTFVGVQSENPQPSYTIDCSNNTLQLFANPPLGAGGVTYIYEWTGPNMWTSSLENPVITNVDGTWQGNYNLTIRGITGCTAMGAIFVPISELPPVTPDFFTVEDEICSNGNVVLTASSPPGSGALQYIWLLENSAGDMALDTTNTPFYSFAAPMVEDEYCYYVIALRGNGCTSDPSITKCIQVTEAPTAALVNDAITVCEGDEILLEAILPLPGPGVEYVWSGPNDSQSGPQFQLIIPEVALSDEGMYQLTAYRNGCQSNTISASVVVNDRPDQPEITSNAPVCLGDTLKLYTDIQGGATYVWRGPNLQEFFTNTPSLSLANTDNNYDGNWRVRVVSQDNCTSENSLPTDVVVNSLPLVSADSNAPICENEDIVLTANTIVNAFYQWTGPNNFSEGGQTIIAPAVAGTYTVEITDQNGCKGTDDEVVVIKPAPTITSVAASDNDCPNGPEDVTLKALLDPTYPFDVTYQWSGPNFFSTDSCAVIENATIANNGTYEVIVNGLNACSDTSFVQVNMGEIIPTPATPIAGNGATLCEGDDLTLTTSANFPSTDVTYYWITPAGTISTSNPSLSINPVVASTHSGDYRVYALSGDCYSDTSGILLVTVHPTPATIAESNGPVCEGDDIILTASCNIPGATYEWTSDCGFNSSLCSPIIPNADESLHECNYQVRVNVNGCWSAPATVFVSVKPRAKDPIAVENGPYCVNNEDITLQVTAPSATSGGTYHWYQINGANGTLLGSTLSTTYDVPNSVSYTDGTYQFYVIAELNGCFSEASPDITVEINTTLGLFADAGLDQMVCEQDNIVLQGIAPTSGFGQWTGLGANPAGVQITNPNDATTTVTGLVPGNTYGFAWSLSNGACVDYDQDTTYVVVNLVETSEAGDLIVVCNTEETNLDAIAPNSGNGIWSQPQAQEDQGVVIMDINDPQSLVMGLLPDNIYKFTWTIPDNGCGEDSDDVFVQNSLGLAFAGVDRDTCGDGCANLFAQMPAVGFGRWSAPDLNMSFDNVTDATTRVCNLQQGENMFIWTINDGLCGDAGRDTVVIDYEMAPIAEDDIFTVSFADVVTLDVVDNDFALNNYYINLVDQPQSGVIEENADGTFTYTADINFIGNDFFRYELCSDACECSEATVQLNVGGDAKAIVPTIFTPNNDGINDAFVIPALAATGAFAGNSLAIFNQWGDEVFRAAPYLNNWEGTYNGQDLPAGTYYFILDLANGEQPMTGFLILQR